VGSKLPGRQGLLRAGQMSKWLEEDLEDGLRGQYKVKEILASTQSKFQNVDVMDLEPFGRCLVIDGLLQSCEVDEFVYHESLVHPALLLHPNPKKVYIGGGGEGATAREVLRHKSVEKCVMVDIDEHVVAFCKEHLAENKEAFADPRLDVVIDCAKAQLEKAGAEFDVIIMDLDDPLEGGPCYQLYTKEFYDMCKTKLTPGGILVTQSGQAGIKRHHIVWSAIHSTLKASFPRVLPYNQAVYSFMDEWGWNLALSDANSPHKLSVEEVDKRIKDRIKGELKFLDGESWQGLFATSKMHRKTLAAETIVMTKGTHRFMHSTGLTVAEEAPAKKARTD
jgi:thermospermine synthase